MKPPICPNSEIVSSIGSAFAPHVLITIAEAKKASIMSVYCQFGNAKLELVTFIMLSTSVVTTKTPLAALDSHPSVDIQPADHLLSLNFCYMQGLKERLPAA